MEPTNVDILCGRGPVIQRHNVNTLWRNLVDARRMEYLSCNENRKSGGVGVVKRKRKIVDDVLRIVRGYNGRFLARQNENNHNKDGGWYEVDIAVARAKTSQLFRQKRRHTQQNLQNYNNNKNNSSCKPNNSKNTIPQETQEADTHDQNKASLQLMSLESFPENRIEHDGTITLYTNDLSCSATTNATAPQGGDDNHDSDTTPATPHTTTTATTSTTTSSTKREKKALLHEIQNMHDWITKKMHEDYRSKMVLMHLTQKTIMEVGWHQNRNLLDLQNLNSSFGTIERDYMSLDDDDRMSLSKRF